MPDLARDPVAFAAARVNAAHRDLREARAQLFKALAARARRGGRQPGLCGTPAGYRRHERSRQVPCDACVEAKTWDRKRSQLRPDLRGVA